MLHNEVFDLQGQEGTIGDMDDVLQQTGFLTSMTELRRNYEFNQILTQLQHQHKDKGYDWLLEQVTIAIEELSGMSNGCYTVRSTHSAGSTEAEQLPAPHEPVEAPETDDATALCRQAMDIVKATLNK